MEMNAALQELRMEVEQKRQRNNDTMAELESAFKLNKSALEKRNEWYDTLKASGNDMDISNPILNPLNAIEKMESDFKIEQDKARRFNEYSALQMESENLDKIYKSIGDAYRDVIFDTVRKGEEKDQMLKIIVNASEKKEESKIENKEDLGVVEPQKEDLGSLDSTYTAPDDLKLETDPTLGTVDSVSKEETANILGSLETKQDVQQEDLGSLEATPEAQSKYQQYLEKQNAVYKNEYVDSNYHAINAGLQELKDIYSKASLLSPEQIQEFQSLYSSLSAASKYFPPNPYEAYKHHIDSLDLKNKIDALHNSVNSSINKGEELESISK